MKTFRELVASERPLVLPGAHDALSARLIERAGFKAYFIGGFPLVGARYGIPDIGSATLGEISAGIRDTMTGSALPVLVDCDNGYGDVKTAVHTLQTYERMGAQAVFFEDTMSPKRCGHMGGKQLMSTEQITVRYSERSQPTVCGLTPSSSRGRTRARSMALTKHYVGAKPTWKREPMACSSRRQSVSTSWSGSGGRSAFPSSPTCWKAVEHRCCRRSYWRRWASASRSTASRC